MTYVPAIDVADNSVDFVFSFDSLVDPDRDVIESYLRELAKKLKVGAKREFFTPTSRLSPIDARTFAAAESKNLRKLKAD